MIRYMPIPVLFKIGGIRIYSLWLITIMAVLVSCFLIIKELKNIKSGKKIKKLGLVRIADLSSPYIALGFAIFWIGAFLGWKGYGKPADIPFAVWVNNVPYHPTQIYLAAGSLAIFLVLFHLKKRSGRGILKKKGNLFFLFLLLYSTLNFVVDFFRYYPQKEFLIGLAVSQWIDIILIFSSITSLILRNQEQNSESSEIIKKKK